MGRVSGDQFAAPDRLTAVGLERSVSSARLSDSLAAVEGRLKALPWSWLLLAAISLGALAHRLYLASGDSLPLGDGGMFYAVIEQIKANDYRLPEFITYNKVDIPFAYSPLSFYLAALITDVSGIETLQVMRFLPIIGSVLTIPAFYLLARAMLKRADAAIIATAFFAAHESFVKLIMGGGLPRSFGLFFALLALYHLYRLANDEKTNRRLVLAAVFVALTTITHQEMAWLVALFYAVMLCASVRSLRDVQMAAGVGVLSLFIIAPWLGVILLRHGIDPYLAAMSSGSRLAMPSIGLLAFPVARRWPIPALLLASLYLGGRNVDFPLSISQALLLGALSGWLLSNPALLKARDSAARKALRLASVSAALLLVLLLVLPVYGRTSIAIEGWVGRAEGERASFEWIRNTTPEESRFVVIADTDEWGYDHTGEWLPVLGDRETLTTVQGREWLRGDQGYTAARESYSKLRTCITADTTCLESWQPVQRSDYTHVYITKDACCLALRESLQTAPGYRLVYDGAGSQIFERLSGP